MRELVPMLAMCLCGGAAGLIGIKLRLPLGGLIGGAVGAGAYQMVVGDAAPPGNSYQVGIQLGVGIIVGGKVTREIAAVIGKSLGAIIIYCVGITVVGLLVGWSLLVLTGGTDLVTAILASAPAGATEMGITALSIGADVEVVATTHMLRVSSLALSAGIVLPIYARRWSPSDEKRPR